ncbi:MAG TPA: hypothetical protein VGC71_09570 [Gaiellales bacterium]|jgi:hypothetical protein
MAVLMILEWQGVTTDDYDRVNEAMGITGDDDAPDGLIQHVSAVSDDGDVLIADVWESEEQLGRFVESRLGPAIGQLGLPESEPRIMPVHNTIRGRAQEPRLLVLIDVPTGTTDQYDAMLSQMPAHTTADGHPAYIHVAARTGAGLVVADVWPSPEAFGEFAEQQIGPAAQHAGVTDIQPRMLRVHNTIRGRAGVPS